MGANRRDGVVFKQPKSEGERAKVAKTCKLGLKLSIPVLVDGIDNAVCTAYSAWPDRLYIVDKDGRIAYKGAPGPRGFRPGEMEPELEKIAR